MRRAHLFLLLVFPCIIPSRSGVVALAATSASTPRSSSMDFLQAEGHVGATITAGAEIMEDVESVGHGHGMLLLCGSRLCRELNVMRESLEGEAEDIEENTKLGRGAWRKPLNAVLRVLGSPILSASLALGGLGAAFLEVLQDSRPGGHHGAIFLALNELLELLEESHVARGRLLKIAENQTLRLCLVTGAALFATMETLRSFKKVGAHHGVLLLAISKMFKCLGMLQSRLKEKEA